MQRLPNERFYCSRNQGTPLHCTSKVKMMSAASQKPALVLCRRGIWPKDSKVSLLSHGNRLDSDAWQATCKPFVGTGLGGMGTGWPGLQVRSACYKRSVSILPLHFLTLLYVHKHTGKRCERFMILTWFCSNKKQSEW